MRIAVVADSHLAQRAPECRANWAALRDAIAGSGAALTIHLGDISLDAATQPHELAEAAALCADWPTPLRVLPGNHDLGSGSGEEPLDLSRIDAYERCFGARHWIVDAAPHWQLVGLDAQVLGSGHALEAAQDAWLAARLRERPEVAHRLLFLHRPLIRAANDEPGRAGRYVQAAAAQALLDGPLRATLRAVVSGHTHQWLDHAAHGVQHLWMPSCAFVIPDRLQNRVGNKQVGYALIELGASDADGMNGGWSHRIERPPTLHPHALDRLACFDGLHASPPPLV